VVRRRLGVKAAAKADGRGLGWACLDALALSAEAPGAALVAALATVLPVGLGIDAAAVALDLARATAALARHTALGQDAGVAALTAVVGIAPDVDAAVEAVLAARGTLSDAAAIGAHLPPRTDLTAATTVAHVSADIHAGPAARDAAMGAPTRPIGAELPELASLVTAAAVVEIGQRVHARLAAALREQGIAAVG